MNWRKVLTKKTSFNLIVEKELKKLDKLVQKKILNLWLKIILCISHVRIKKILGKWKKRS
nr:hypothetical protein A5482_09500 [Cyanobacterium sp. IPPAS B-1200]